jgi:hypothetical protein
VGEKKNNNNNNNNQSAKLRKNRKVFYNHNAASIGLKQQKELRLAPTKCIDLSTLNIVLLSQK